MPGVVWRAADGGKTVLIASGVRARRPGARHPGARTPLLDQRQRRQRHHDRARQPGRHRAESGIHQGRPRSLRPGGRFRSHLLVEPDRGHDRQGQPRRLRGSPGLHHRPHLPLWDRRQRHPHLLGRHLRNGQRRRDRPRGARRRQRPVPVHQRRLGQRADRGGARLQLPVLDQHRHLRAPTGGLQRLPVPARPGAAAAARQRRRQSRRSGSPSLLLASTGRSTCWESPARISTATTAPLS